MYYSIAFWLHQIIKKPNQQVFDAVHNFILHINCNLQLKCFTQVTSQVQVCMKYADAESREQSQRKIKKNVQADDFL